MKTVNETVVFEQEQVVQAGTVVGMLIACAALVLVAAFSSGCVRDVYVDSPQFADVLGETYEDDTSFFVPPADGTSEDKLEEGDCAGPWGCKSYADIATLPPECEDDDGCADGFVCSGGQCVPANAEDVTEDSGDALEQQRYPLEIATQDNGTPEQECHCGVGYICENGMCVKVGGENNNPPNNDEDVQPEPDVISQEDVGAAEPADSSSFDTAQDDSAEPGDVVAQTDVGAEEPEVIADGGTATPPFDGAKCAITCPTDYTSVRIWWAFTSADVVNGAEFSIPRAELCLWGEMAFEYNCFNSETGIWGGYLTATVSCQPTDYELEDTGIHGKVKFDESCW